MQDKAITPEAIYHELREKFYVNIPFAMPHATIEKAVQAFFRFLDEPDVIKSHIDFSISPLHRRGDIGFKNRFSDDHLYHDDKEFFHYHPAIFEKYADFLETHKVVHEFLLEAKPIWELCHQTIKNVMAAFELESPGVVDSIFQTNMPHIVLRFLRYRWQKSGEYLAKPHFDAGGFTLAIAESCAGLRIGSCPDNLTLVQHQEGHAIFMFASNFKKVINSNDFSAGWHDVIQLDKNRIGQPFSRWAVVAFIDAHDVEAVPRSETHKWYQGEVLFEL